MVMFIVSQTNSHKSLTLLYFNYGKNNSTMEHQTYGTNNTNNRYYLLNPSIADVFNKHLRPYLRCKVSILSKNHNKIYNTSPANVIISIMETTPKAEIRSVIRRFRQIPGQCTHLNVDEYQDVLVEMLSIKLRQFGYNNNTMNKFNFEHVEMWSVLCICAYGREIDLLDNYDLDKNIRCEYDFKIQKFLRVITMYIIVGADDEVNVMFNIFVRLVKEYKDDRISQLDYVTNQVMKLTQHYSWFSADNVREIEEFIISRFILYNIIV